jgi:predicted DNA-binding transcriptional regulator YafY
MPPWAERIKQKQMMVFQKITECDDGAIIYETMVNSLEEIASWIVSRGEGIIVMEPVELRELVIDRAKGALKNYELRITNDE